MIKLNIIISSVQISHSVVSDSLWPHRLQHTRPHCITSSESLLKLMSIESVMPYNHLILFSCCLQFFPASGSFQMSQFFASRCRKCWSLSFSISPSNEYSGLLFFSMNWLDLLAVQGTLKSLLQHHSSKASILKCSAFFIVQLSHPYMTIG